MADLANTITIDWETFYSKEFSLTKMTTQQYVLSEFFEAIGVGVKLNGDPVEWYSDTPGGVALWLRQFPWDTATVLAHNAIFDAAILEWQFGIHPARYHCTMQASRPLYVPWTPNGKMSLATIADYLNLPPKGDEVVRAIGMRRRDFSPEQLAAYGRYCKTDTELCYMIYLDQVQQLTQMELDLIDATVKKYVRPMFQLDRNILTQRLDEVRVEKEEVLSKALLVDNAVLMSNPQFAEALENLGVSPPTKISPRTGKTTFAFAKNDPEFKELLEHPDSRVQALVAARLKHKSTQEETRLVRFLQVDDTDAPFAVPLLYYGAHTGRLSGLDKLNMQNLPRGGALRRALKAPPGYKVVAGDLSQIEARILATLAGQSILVNAFRSGADVYSMFATQVYGYQVTKATHEFPERFVGKTCFAADTQVLTRRGWTPIIDVSDTDELWDGVEWVKHAGVITVGEKPTITHHGITATGDHEILVGDTWVEWQNLANDNILFQSALNSVSLPSCDMSPTPQSQAKTGAGGRSVVARAAQKIQSMLATYVQGVRRAVINAPKWQPVPSVTGNTATPCLMTRTVPACLTASQLVSHAATTPNSVLTTTTVDGASAWRRSGETTVQRFSAMCKHFLGGMTPRWRWTAKTTTVTTNQAIFALPPERKTWETEEKYINYNKKTTVYDICFAGPRTRFCVLSESGPLIAHNCILGLGYQVGAEKLRTTLKAGGVEVTLEEADRYVRTYRSTYKKIRQLWYTADAMIRYMADGKTIELGPVKTIKDGILLPNGRRLIYPDLRRDSLGQWVYTYRGKPATLYGGKLIENIVQALAAIVVSTAEVYLYRRGWLSSLQVHDELVFVVLESLVEKFCKVLEKVLTMPVEWMPNLPVAAEVAYGDNYAEAK